MSHVLAISSSGPLAWLNRKPSVCSQWDALLEVHVKASHETTHHTDDYGSPSSQDEQKISGHIITQITNFQLTLALVVF
jgi:hypothetical protein